MGMKLAELVAERLGYECVAREILLEGSERFGVPETKLLRAIHDAPSVLERLVYGDKEKFVAYIQAVLLRHLQKDNVVYHGLAGQFFLQGVSHVLKVRVVADTENRIQTVMDRDNVPRDRAAAILKYDDSERLKWSQSLYGIDSRDPSLYDMVLRIQKLTVEDAAEMISHAAGLEHFRTTPESQQIMNDRVLAAEVKAVLVGVQSDVKVWASSGAVRVAAKTQAGKMDALRGKLEEAAHNVEGVQSVEIHLEPPLGSVWMV
jgi:cytidylate kinase